MRSQFIILFSISLLVLSSIFYGYFNSLKVEYNGNPVKYIAYYSNLLRNDYGCDNINSTIYLYCSSLGGLCYCNLTNTIVEFTGKIYILS